MDKLLKLLQLLPLLVETLKVVESLWPEGESKGKGAEKLETLRGLLMAGYEGITEMWPTIEKAVSVIVAAMNKSGLFKK